MLGELPEFPDVLTAEAEGVAPDLRHVLHHGEAFIVAVPLLEACLEDDPATIGPALVAQFALVAGFPALPKSMELRPRLPSVRGCPLAFARSAAAERCVNLGPT
jgi:hypothetical protein